MKTAALLLLLALTLPLLVGMMRHTREAGGAAETVRHVVVFKYAPDATEAQIQAITDAFRALQDEIPGIVAFEHGVNNSPEGLNQGFTHVYLLTFEDAAARDAYLPHPAHQAFGKTLGDSGIFEGAFVIDYVPQD